MLETDGQEDQVCENQSPISNITRRTLSNHPTLTPKHSERAFFPDAAMRSDRNSVGRLGGIGQLETHSILNISYIFICHSFGF